MCCFSASDHECPAGDCGEQYLRPFDAFLVFGGCCRQPVSVDALFDKLALLDWCKEAEGYFAIVSQGIVGDCGFSLYIHAYHISACDCGCGSRYVDSGRMLLDSRQEQNTETI